MRVVHLNTYQATGGAAVAAGRLNRALNQIGVDSTLLVQEATRAEADVEALATSFLAKKMAFARFGGERLAFCLTRRISQCVFSFRPPLRVSILPTIR